MKKFNLIIKKEWISSFILPYELILEIEEVMKKHNIPLKRRGKNVYGFLVDLIMGEYLKKDFKVSNLLYIENKRSIQQYIEEIVVKSDFDKDIYLTIEKFIKNYDFDTTLTIFYSSYDGELCAYTNRSDNDPGEEAIQGYELDKITTGNIIKSKKYYIGSVVSADGIFQDIENQYYWYWEEDLHFGKYLLKKFDKENIKDYI